MTETAHVRDAITNEAKRIEEDAEHSSQRQFEATRQWNGWNLLIGISTAITAALASASALAESPTLAAFLGMAAAAGAAIATFLKPSDRASQCSQSGNSFLALRNDARIFRTVQCLQSEDETELANALSALNERRNRLNAEAPNAPRGAFLRGRKRIQAGETTHAVDAPPSEKRGKGPETPR